MLSVDARLERGAFALDAALEAAPGRVTVIVGESGCGKSTLLRLVAGLLVPRDGHVRVDGATWADAATGTHVAPEARPVGWVPQDHALFPHLAVRENVAFGLRAAGVGGATARERTERALERFGLRELATRRPAQLSGGQRQRVALARALVLEPRVLLLAALPCVTLFVTHAPAEALALGDDIVVMEQGRVTQSGARDAFVRHPRSAYAAEFLGVNLLRGAVRARPGDGHAVVAAEGGELFVPDPGRDGDVQCVVHPHDVVLSRTAPEGSARNVFRGRVQEVVPEPPAGERVRVLVDSRPPLAAQVMQASVAALGLHPGAEVWASFKATAVRVLEEE